MADAPFRTSFDAARDPLTARNAIGAVDAKFVTDAITAGGSFQPLDADLTAIAALTGTNTIYYRSAANTWSPVNISTGLAFSGGNLTATAAGSPTFQRFASGSGTYTTPAGVKYIHVQMVGGGGGGGSGATGGGAGGSTTFGTLTATGGAINGVVPGSGSGADLNFDGGAGGAGGQATSIGGHGGSSIFGGGGGSGSSGVAARAASANTGGGGGGGGSFSGAASGAGGGAGGACDHVFRTPAATYSYAVGAAGSAGAAGTNTNAGAAGAAGVILVREYY